MITKIYYKKVEAQHEITAIKPGEYFVDTDADALYQMVDPYFHDEGYCCDEYCSLVKASFGGKWMSVNLERDTMVHRADVEIEEKDDGCDFVYCYNADIDDSAAQKFAELRHARIGNCAEEREYMVCIRVTGRVYVPAKAIDPEMARCKANGKVCEMDFGELEDIDWDAVYAENANGNHIDF